MNWRELNPALAKRRFAELEQIGRFEPGELPSEYGRLRQELSAAIPDFSSWKGSRGSYDVEAGLALYGALEQSGFGLRQASCDGIWRYMSLQVIPDLVEGRWPDRQPARYWASRSRMWLRSLWWFTHLAWQENEKATRAVLRSVTTDDIVQLVERPGRRGFRVDLCRALIRARSTRPLGKERFRELMALNTMRVIMTEPVLHESGIDGYVESLYEGIDRAARRRASSSGK